MNEKQGIGNEGEGMRDPKRGERTVIRDRIAGLTAREGREWLKTGLRGW